MKRGYFCIIIGIFSFYFVSFALAANYRLEIININETGPRSL